MGPKEINNDSKNNSVTVHSKLTMVSSVPVNPPGQTSPLTPLDRAMGQHNLHVIFYYRSGSLEFNRIRPSFNEVLTLYPNVTGRLAKDERDGNWEVKFTDAGLRVHFATVKGSVDDWLRFACRDDECDLTVSEDLPDDPQFWSPFRLQITEFEGGGTALALSCPHMLADPMTLTLIVKSWTDAYHRVVITHPPFLNHLAFNHTPKTTTTTSPPYYAARSEKSNLKHFKKMGSATFNFSDSTIKKHLSEICSAVPEATPFDLLTALFWTCIAKLKTPTYNCGEQTIAICMDMRKRLSAPLPCGYFGNALYFSDLTVTDVDMDSKDLGHVTNIVHRHVAGVKAEEFLSEIDWLETRKDGQGKCDLPFKMYGPELTFVTMENMIDPVRTHRIESETQPLMYMASFDKDQKPAHVSYHVENAEGEGLIMVMPSPEEGLARRVSVTLPDEEIRKLVEDDVVLGWKPTLLLSGHAKSDAVPVPE